MRLLLAFEHWSLAAGWHYVNAFRRLGHDVRTAGTYISGDKYWAGDKKTWQPNVEFGPHTGPGWFDAPASVALDELYKYDKWTPDAIITASGFFTLSGKTDMPHLVVSFEPPEYNVGYNRPGIHYDYEFAATPANPSIGNGTCEYLPMGYDPALHKNIIPLKYRPIVASVVGRMDDERKDFVKALMEDTWVVAGSGITPHQYVTVTNTARSSIYYPLYPNTGVSNRAFEAAAMGAIYISPQNDATDKIGMIPDVTYLAYDGTVESCKQQINRSYSEGIEWSQAIVDRATEWVREHTYDARCERMIEVIRQGVGA